MTPCPLLTDEEIGQGAEGFCPSLPDMPLAGERRDVQQSFRAGARFARSIYETDRAALLAEIERLKAAVQPLGGIINALHSYRTEWASPVPDPDWQMKLRKRLFSQWDKSQPIPLPEKGSE